MVHPETRILLSRPSFSCETQKKIWCFCHERHCGVVLDPIDFHYMDKKKTLFTISSFELQPQASIHKCSWYDL